MGKKADFINFVEDMKGTLDEAQLEGYADALDFYESYKKGKAAADKPRFTDNGIMILSTMKQEIDEFDNSFTAKQIADAGGLNARGVSGAIRKLVTDGYVEVLTTEPNVYALTNEGKDVELDENLA